ncbi:MAG: diacylglycerol kinase family protein [Pseudomonadota bacterium]
MSRIFVIVNAASGSGSDEELSHHVQGLFESAGIPAEVYLARGGEQIAARIKDAIAQQADVIVAGGGDGTVSMVAAALAGGDIALGILPLGTLNHFAKDLGLPLALDEAVREIASGRRLRVDVGEVNGRVFVNNSSLGLYPDIVYERDREQQRVGRGKWLAFLRATVAALRKYPFLNVSLEVDGRKHQRRTPIVFIGNNEYRMQGLALGERVSLTGGRLSLYTTQRSGRLRLVQLALRALAGLLKQARDFDALLATEIVVESGHQHLRVATDGEITVMTSPLRYRIRPGSLTVLGAVTPGAKGR